MLALSVPVFIITLINALLKHPYVQNVLSKYKNSVLKCLHWSNYNSDRLTRKIKIGYAVWDKSCFTYKLTVEHFKHNIVNINLNIFNQNCFRHINDIFHINGASHNNIIFLLVQGAG